MIGQHEIRLLITSINQLIETAFNKNGIWHKGVVQSINSSDKTCNITLDGSTTQTQVQYLNGYLPKINDNVEILIRNGQGIIYGAFALITDNNVVMPAGIILNYAGSSAPTGTLLCDGSAISRTTYSRLYAAIGTNYGAGDGSTTFNIPNFVGSIPVAAGQSAGGQSYTLGQSQQAGANHTHTAAGTTTQEGSFHQHGGITAGTAVSGNEGPGHTHNYTGPTSAQSAIPVTVVNFIITIGQ